MLKLRLYLAMLILPFALAGYLINAGQQGMHEAKDFKQPVKLSMAKFTQQHPKEGWFQVNGCRLDMGQVMAKKDDSPDEVFIPLVAADAKEGGNSPVVLRTDDPELLRTYAEMQALPDTASQEQRLQFVQQHAAAFKPGQFQGMVQAGVDSKEKIVSRIAELQGVDKSQLLILDHNRKPRQMGSSQAMFGGGIAVAVIAVIGWILFLIMKIARRA